MRRRQWLSHITMQQVLLLPSVQQRKMKERNKSEYTKTMVPDPRSSSDFPKDHGKVRPLAFYQPSADLSAPLCTIYLPSYLNPLLELKKSLKMRMEWFDKRKWSE